MNYKDLRIGSMAWLLALIIFLFSAGYMFLAPFMTSPPPDIIFGYPDKWQQIVKTKDCRETDLSTEERANLYLKWSFLNQKPTLETNKMVKPDISPVPAVSGVQTEPTVEEPVEQPTKQPRQSQKPKSSESRHHGHGHHRIWYTKHGHRFYHY